MGFQCPEMWPYLTLAPIWNVLKESLIILLDPVTNRSSLHGLSWPPQFKQVFFSSLSGIYCQKHSFDIITFCPLLAVICDCICDSPPQCVILFSLLRRRSIPFPICWTPPEYSQAQLKVIQPLPSSLAFVNHNSFLSTTIDSL